MGEGRGAVVRTVSVVRILLVLVGLALPLAALVAACGGSASVSGADGGGDAAARGRPKRDAASDVTILRPENDASVDLGTLSIKPSVASLTVTNAASPPSQTFTASLTKDGKTAPAPVTWSLSTYSLGTISSGGKFEPVGTVGGVVTVTASYGVLTASAKLTVTVHTTANLSDVTLPDGTVISEDSSAITAADMTALSGTPSDADSGTPTTLIYPYDKTVFPLGLLAPVAQFSAGSVPPVDFKISLDTTDFHWDGFGHVGNPMALQAAIPQNVWDGALASATGTGGSGAVTMSLVKAAAGVAYGPAVTHLTIANGKLTGVIYYESYSTDPIDGGADAPGSTDFGLWAVKPGLVRPPQHLEPGCVICHGVSANGSTLTNGTDQPANGPSTGVFRVEADGGYTHLATAPLALPYNGGSGGPADSRGLGWGTNSPDGKVILRSIGDFWGGQALLAWATPKEPLLADGGLQPLSTSMTVKGGLNMFVPQFSLDGKHLVYVTAQNPGDASGTGALYKSIGMLDITTELAEAGAPDGGWGTVTLAGAHTVYDTTTAAADAGGNVVTKVPTFLPDSESVVFEETRAAQYPQFDYMLPDDGPVDGELAGLQKTPSGAYVRVALTNANSGYDPNAPTVNYEPKPLPIAVGGYYWVVFASTRTDAYPLLSTGGASPKKLWVTAISPGTKPGNDPSHPAFTLINQAIVAPQRSQRAYWALAPCQGVGASCETGSDCCNGSCIPGSPTDPSSALVCKAASAACASIGGRCTPGDNASCCGASTGVQCIGTLNGYGTCTTVGAPP